MENTVLDARYRADTLDLIRMDAGQAAGFLRKDIRPIWENVLLSIEYGQSLRGEEPMINFLLFEIAQILAIYGCPRWMVNEYIYVLKKRIFQYA